MYSHNFNIRVRYADTDQMGYVYYGKYAEYFEVGRAELIRSLGLSYREVEERGILMPVSELEIKYFLPAKYDELLTIRTTLPEMPQARFTTVCEVLNEEGKLLVRGVVRLAFLDQERMRPVRVPAFIREALEKHLAS